MTIGPEPSRSATRLDVLLAAHVADATRAQVQRWIRDGTVSVNGEVVAAPAQRVQAADIVTARWDDVGAEAARTVNPDVQVVYHDDHLAVVDKPAGVAVHPGHGRDSGTLVDTLVARFPQLARLEPADRPGIVHRIDMDTSGLLAVGLTANATQALSEAIRRRAVARRYLALVEGVPERRAAIIDGPIGRDAANPMRQAIDPYGREARTRYAVVKTLGVEDRQASLLALALETGRMHQIRLHLNAIGHPVVGDPTYRGRSPLRGHGLTRQFLHAHQLEFDHPATGERMSLRSELPRDLAECMERLERG